MASNWDYSSAIVYSIKVSRSHRNYQSDRWGTPQQTWVDLQDFARSKKEAPHRQLHLPGTKSSELAKNDQNDNEQDNDADGRQNKLHLSRGGRMLLCPSEKIRIYFYFDIIIFRMLNDNMV